MNRTPADLAQSVSFELNKRKSIVPKQELLVELFETMYYASLTTEESQPISFHVVYADPKNPDPDPPENIRNDRWTFVCLKESVPLTIPNLIKIAKASDPRTSSFALYHDSQGHLFIWGFVDQGNSYNDYVNYESESGFARPGIFQASIVGVGHLAAFVEMNKIAELKVNSLITNSLDILWGGPIHDALMPGATQYLDALKTIIPSYQLSDRSHWETSLTSYWIESICRLLLRVQKYHHGGALLLSPNTSSYGLNIKYELSYDRLRSALEKKGVLQVQKTYTSDRIFQDFIDNSADEIPLDLYLDESISSDDLEDNRRELDGAIWFVSLLTRVDGLVLLSQNLEVKGFGVEITISDEPSSVFMAGNRNATKSKLRKINYNHYGTRHRSMMRYCAQVSGSVGFVISQDGDVRAMTQVDGKLVVWENIKLQLPEFPRRKRMPSS